MEPLNESVAATGVDTDIPCLEDFQFFLAYKKALYFTSVVYAVVYASATEV